MSSQLWFTTSRLPEQFFTNFNSSLFYFNQKRMFLWWSPKHLHIWTPMGVLLDVSTWITPHHSHWSPCCFLYIPFTLPPDAFTIPSDLSPWNAVYPDIYMGNNLTPGMSWFMCSSFSQWDLSCLPYLKFQPDPLLPWLALMIHFPLLYFVYFFIIFFTFY